VSRSRVLIVDDSALVRQILREILSSDSALEVVGAASDPFHAWSIIQTANPDVVTLDVEMPRMDGLEFLERLMRAHPMPVVMVSSLTERGCETTFKALELGAVDYVTKPTVDIGRGVEALAREIVEKVKMAARARPRRPRRESATRSPMPLAATPVGSVNRGALARSTEIVMALGASTGGTEAIREVLTAMPADAPGMVIVQHMPENFTRLFAERLDKMCAIRVREATDGERVIPGIALLAPGGATHMQLQRCGGQYVVRLVSTPPRHHHRPSVDVLFESCADQAGRNAVGAIMTGMGDDGARGLLAMRSAGAHTVAEHESTCVVYGMPRAAVEMAAAEVVQPLHAIAETLLRFAAAHGSG
jgi:two-component system chemotaxis response regulator CheB